MEGIDLYGKTEKVEAVETEMVIPISKP